MILPMKKERITFVVFILALSHFIEAQQKEKLSSVSHFSGSISVTQNGISLVPIPGTIILHRLVENIGAASIKLTVEELQEIEDTSAEIEIMGTRYTEAMEKSTGL